MMNRHSPQTYQDRITDEAAEWFARVQESAFNAEDRAAFATWLQASAENVREYLQVAAMWQDIEELGPEPDIDALIKAAQSDHDQNILPLFDDTSDRSERSSTCDHNNVGGRTNQDDRVEGSQTARHSWLKWNGIAASMVLVIGIVVFFNTGPSPTTYQTGIGELISFPLPDGSIVTLNTQSTILLRYSDTYRDIILTQGEVLFDVVKEPNRRFRVLTDDAVIEAIGTRFNVHYRDADTTVTVVEGIIAVKQTGQAGQATTDAEPVQVSAGQQARVDTDTVVITVTDADLTKATAWQLRRLVFESKPLAYVIAEFNLYNDPPIIISDPGLELLPISGAFSANDRASFVLFLEKMNLAQSRTQRDGRILLSRRE